MTEPKYIDYLKENTEFEYRGVKQNWVLMSFVSPEGIKNCKIRGLKIHGIVDDYEVAKKKAEEFRLSDPDFHVFVGPVGKWLPWDPDPNSAEDQVYQEKELNELVKGYKENLEKAKLMEKQRKEDMLNNVKNEEKSKKDQRIDRMRKKLEEKKNNKMKEMTKKDVEIENKLKEVEKEEEEVKKEKENLEKLEKELKTKEDKVESIDEKLNKLQSVYNKLQQKQKE